MIAKQRRRPKYSTRAYNRCKVCGRPHAYLVKIRYAAYVLGNLHTGEKSRVLKRPAGRAL